MPRVIDVMLPYYGDVDLMKAAVRSVLKQSYPHWRLVVIDDGYPDPEPERWFGEIEDDRVSYQRNEVNLGVNGNFRKAVELVEADWFVMMGSDDIMGVDYLRVVAEAAQNHNADIIQPGVDVIDEDGTVYLPLSDRVKRMLQISAEPGGTVVGGERLAASLLGGNWAYFPSLMWRTKAVRAIGFHPEHEVVLDLALILDIVARGGSMALLPETVFQYRRHSESASSVWALDGRRFDEERRFFYGEAERFANMGWRRAARAARLHLTSRLNAASLLLTAARKGGSPRALARHMFT